MIVYRIADGRHAIFDPTGAMLHGGRWNSPGHPVIYASETYAGALLEILVHANMPRPPGNQQVIRIEIPDETEIEELTQGDAKGWDSDDISIPRAYGDRWFREGRTAVLKVPSVVTRGYEHNFVLNTLHPQFAAIIPGKPEPVLWDKRLYTR